MNPNFLNSQSYQYPQDIPEQYLEIVEELRKQVQNIRLNSIPQRNVSRINPRGNVAVAKLELATGKVYIQEATSKKYPLNIPGIEGGPKLFFESRLDRYGRINNERHAEYKIFNGLAEDLEKDGVSRDVEGILYLYTERNTCSGCLITSEDFKQSFPYIKQVIFYQRPYPPEK